GKPGIPQTDGRRCLPHNGTETPAHKSVHICLPGAPSHNATWRRASPPAVRRAGDRPSLPSFGRATMAENDGNKRNPAPVHPRQTLPVKKFPSLPVLSRPGRAGYEENVWLLPAWWFSFPYRQNGQTQAQGRSLRLQDAYAPFTAPLKGN